jgi:hypothetical protein
MEGLERVATENAISVGGHIVLSAGGPRLRPFERRGKHRCTRMMKEKSNESVI